MFEVNISVLTKVLLSHLYRNYDYFITATGDEFRKFFEQFGTVIDSIVMYDHETHRSRGFGFVTFKDPESSRRVLSMGNAKNGQLEDDNNNTNTNNDPPVARLEMRGKKIEVKAAEPKESTPRHYDERHGRNRECPPFPPPVNPDMMIMYGPNDPNLYYNYNAPAQYYAPHAFTTGYVAPMYYPGQFAQHYPPVVPMVEGYHQYMDAAYAYVPFATPIPPIYEQPYEQLHEQPYGITSDMQPVPPTISAKEGAEEVEGATQ